MPQYKMNYREFQGCYELAVTREKPSFLCTPPALKRPTVQEKVAASTPKFAATSLHLQPRTSFCQIILHFKSSLYTLVLRDSIDVSMVSFPAEVQFGKLYTFTSYATQLKNASYVQTTVGAT